MRIILLAAVGLLWPVVAQELAHDTPPRIIYKVEPQYSKEARQSRLEGAVIMRVIVGADGTPRDPRILRSLGLGLDENAIAAVSRWRFAPGTKNGEPVDVHAQIEVNFRMLDKGARVRWHLQRVEFHLPDGVSRPMVEKVAAPHLAGDAATPTVKLTFDIDERGVPVHIPIEKASSENFSREVAAALSKWRFTPAFKNGHPISVSCTMDFVRGN